LAIAQGGPPSELRSSPRSRERPSQRSTRENCSAIPAGADSDFRRKKSLSAPPGTPFFFFQDLKTVFELAK